MLSFFFFNDTATTEIYTLSLHDALPICSSRRSRSSSPSTGRPAWHPCWRGSTSRTSSARDWRLARRRRSEEHTSELQSRQYLVCRLLLEKKFNFGLNQWLQYRDIGRWAE